jgi:hypothetical protein
VEQEEGHGGQVSEGMSAISEVMDKIYKIRNLLKKSGLVE